MASITWNDPFIGRLSAHYISIVAKKKVRLQDITLTSSDGEETKISLEKMWINQLPAEYLKGFRSSQMPQKLKNEKFEKIQDNFYLNFEDWGWFKNLQVQELEIKVIHLEEYEHVFPVVSCLKILGLKKIIQKELKLETSFRKYFLFYENYKLVDENTLSECGIKKGEVIDLKLQEDSSSQRSSHLQMATGSEYQSTTDFNDYFSILTKRIGIVCQIELRNENSTGPRYGTGFLIGKNLIMTNAHVISSKEDCKCATAHFFYHKKSENKAMQIPLDELIHCSSSPFENKIPTMENLDFSIIRLKTDWTWNPIHAIRIRLLARMAISFFKEPEAPPKPKKTRANIIQHPLDLSGGRSTKQIAFRENFIKEVDLFLLHYESATRGGSSGSPVIDDQGKFIGLHRSECLEIEHQLFQKLTKLLERLQLNNYQVDVDRHMYHSFETEPNLQVYYKGKDKGFCEKKGGEKFSLLTLIERWAQSDEPPRAWAFNFLKEQNNTIDSSHIYCNTAITATMIFKNLKAKNKLEEIKQAQDFSLVDLKPFIPIGAFSICISVYLIYRMLKKR